MVHNTHADAIAPLKAGHWKQKLAHEICTELTVHTMIGEEGMPSEGMFARCRRTNVDLVALGEQMWVRRQELLAQAKVSSLAPAQTHALMPAAA